MSKVTMRRPDARAMAQLLAEQTQTAAGLILRLAWRQGLTREEIQRLTWNDVDFSAHQLRLPDRTIPLETETEDCLRRQAERPDPPTPFVVVSDRRRQQMPGGISQPGLQILHQLRNAGSCRDQKAHACHHHKGHITGGGTLEGTVGFLLSLIHI